MESDNKFEGTKKIGDKTYKILVFPDQNKISFNVELTSNSTNVKEFCNKFEKSQLSEIESSYENQSLDEILDDLLTLLDEEKFEIIDNETYLNFTIKKTRKRSLNLQLNIKIKEINFQYENLSDEMKAIIDKNELILGIDLGTTYSCSCVVIDGNYLIIQNSFGSKITPSYVAFLSKNKVCVGELAKLFPSFSKNIIYNVKRLIGKDNIDINNISLPFQLAQDNEYNNIKIEVKEPSEPSETSSFYYPEEIYSIILKKIITDSEYYLTRKIGRPIHIKNVVITIPAYFNQKQRRATKIGAEILGLNVKGMINEPTAACLASIYKQEENKTNYIVIIDFGGGTLDITLLKYEKGKDGVYFVVKFTYGDSNFGGENFDFILMEKCTGNNNLNKNLYNNIRLKRVCESAKIKLSNLTEAEINLEEYEKNKSINKKITRNDFEDYCKDLFTKFENILNQFISDCGVNKEEMKEVLLIGGTTLIPKIQEIIKSIFGENKIRKDLDSKESVAIGAAIKGAIISNLSSVSNIKLLDVINLSLGINTYGNRMSKIIKRSSPVPYPGCETYKTVFDNQTSASIEIFEGEDKDTRKNLCLGKFKIINLPKKPAGKAEIIVKFFINRDSLLEVTAIDESNERNKENRIFKYDSKDKENQEIDIIEPKDLKVIINDLKIKQNEIKIIDGVIYNNIKDWIIQKEEQVFNFMKNKDKYKENIRDSKRQIIEKLNIFIIDLLRDLYSNKNLDKLKQNFFVEYPKLKEETIDLKIFTSFLKYFFKKTNEYFSRYSNNSNDNDQTLLGIIKINLQDILNYLQFYDSSILNEIIEDFEPNSNLYYECLSILLQNYDARINEKFYHIYSLYKKGHYKYLSNRGEFEQTLRELEELNDSINSCVIMFRKIPKDNIPNVIKFKESYFCDFQLMIKAIKQILLYDKRRISYDLSFEELYNQCLSLNYKDYSFIKLRLYEICHQRNPSIAKELPLDKIADFFEEYLKKVHDFNYLESAFIFLFEHYPPINDFLPEDYVYLAKIRLDCLVKEKLHNSDFIYKISDCYGKMADRETNQEKRNLLSRIQAIINTIKR